MLCGGSGGFDGCKASGYTPESVISLSVVGLDVCRASAALNAYLDKVDKSSCVNILEVWYLKVVVVSSSKNKY